MSGLRLTVELLGFMMVFTGWLDAWKYHISADKLRQVKLAKGHSRRFINYALANDIVKLSYLITSSFLFGRVDWFLIICTIFALIFMIEHWFCLYLYYPYKGRGFWNFNRPSVWEYFINSLQHNKTRKRL